MKLIFKIMKPSTTFHGVGYNDKKQKKGTAKLVHAENFGHLQFGGNNVTKEEFEWYLDKYSKRNTRIKKPQFHAMLSCKANEFTHEQLKDQALKLMEELGYGENPILIYEHNDTANNHVHIVTSRVGQDGKKIAHDMEGVRANKLVRDILQQDPVVDFDINLAKAMSYDFSTDSQMYLLMERMGYDFKEMPDRVLFYKHGGQQGELRKINLLKKIELNKSLPKNADQIKALIHKYSKTYSPKIKSSEHPTYTTAKPQYESELTHFLKEKMGLEFIFFTSRKGAEKPFGYVVIDHHNKTVFKGSEVIRLNEFMELGNGNFNLEAKKSHEKASKIDDSVTLPNTDNLDENKNENLIDTLIGKVIEISELFVDEHSHIQSGGAENTKRRKKRKNNFF